MLQIRQMLSCGAVVLFLFIFLCYGVADSLVKLPQIKGSKLWDKTEGKAIYITPDFSQYNQLITLSSREFPLDESNKRVIIVGDVHGMIKPLQKLLKTTNYSPSQDALFHVGDIMSRGSLKGSLAVLDFMTRNNVTGVRGNHDQKVIEWRGWLNWISGIPRASHWLTKLEERWHEEKSNDDTLQSWLKKAKNSASREDKYWWKLVPKKWLLFDDHYSIARDMSDQHYQYLLKLPLRLYIPSAHSFIVHAGLLPYNPHYPVDDSSKQPLARVPDLPRHSDTESSLRIMAKDPLDGPDYLSNLETRPSHKYDKRIEQLRNLQEIAILKEIPQNTDPWVTLNMRNVANGEVKRRQSRGTPWAKIWEEQMKSCVGYDTYRVANNTLISHTDKDHKEMDTDDDQYDLKGLDLLCYPSTTVYGHAASRGIKARRWSFGLDSGCAYNKNLTALVIQGKKIQHGTWSSPEELGHEPDDFPENDDSAMLEEKYDLPFGDRNFAKVVSVKC